MGQITLQFATTNQGKIREARDVLLSFGIEIEPLLINFAEPTEGSISEVALHKLTQVMKEGYQNVMVEDSGIFFAAYSQFPGILSKRVFQGIGYQGIEKLLAGETREAWFEGAVAVNWKGKTEVFSAKTFGQIIPQKDQKLKPESGLPFDPIFVPRGETQVLRQLPYQKRMEHSYRRKTLVQLARWIHKMEGVES